MKQGIINFVMGTLRFHQIPDWDMESAKNFCKYILDEEKIEYQEEDFHSYSVNGDTNVIETVKQYAEKYKDIYKANDIKK